MKVLTGAEDAEETADTQQHVLFHNESGKCPTHGAAAVTVKDVESHFQTSSLLDNSAVLTLEASAECC